MSDGIPPECLYLLNLLHSIKVYHWSTRVYSRHDSTDKLLAKLGPAVDKFVEMFLVTSHGSNNTNNSRKNSNSNSNGNAKSLTMTDASYESVLKGVIQEMTSGNIGSKVANNVALSAGRDSIVEHLYRGVYLSRMTDSF